MGLKGGEHLMDQETINFLSTWDDIDDNLEEFLHTENGLALQDLYNNKLGGN